jgi:hypothetical protein
MQWIRRNPLRAALMVLGGLVAAVSVLFSIRTVIFMADVPFDWAIFVEAAERVTEGGLYEDGDPRYSYVYSPVLAYALGWLAPLGPVAWRLLHVVAALALPTWPLRVLVLIAWPFWHDVDTGNLVVFVLLPAAWAMRGNRPAGYAFLALTLLVPRPLMLPLAAWLLWTDARYRIPFAAMFAVHAIAVFASGWGAEWVAQLLAAGNAIQSAHNVSPSRFIGLWWLLIGVPIAAWLTMRGRIGLASLAISPYLLPQYLLMGALELVAPTPRDVAPMSPPARAPARAPHAAQ